MDKHTSKIIIRARQALETWVSLAKDLHIRRISGRFMKTTFAILGAGERSDEIVVLSDLPGSEWDHPDWEIRKYDG